MSCNLCTLTMLPYNGINTSIPSEINFVPGGDAIFYKKIIKKLYPRMNGAFRFLKFKIKLRYLNSLNFLHLSYNYPTIFVVVTGCDMYYVFRLCHNSIHHYYIVPNINHSTRTNDRERKKRIENV
jgi:hypothetical protein